MLFSYRIASVASAVLVLSACVKHPDNVQAQYISHAQYQGLTCDQVGEEMAILSPRIQAVSATQRENANADAAMMTVGLVLFWPVLLAMPATTDRKEELARLKGEYEALDRAGRAKGCSPVKPPLPEVAEAAPVTR